MLSRNSNMSLRLYGQNCQIFTTPMSRNYQKILNTKKAKCASRSRQQIHKKTSTWVEIVCRSPTLWTKKIHFLERHWKREAKNRKFKQRVEVNRRNSLKFQYRRTSWPWEILPHVLLSQKSHFVRINLAFAIFAKKKTLSSSFFFFFAKLPKALLAFYKCLLFSSKLHCPLLLLLSVR